MLMILPDLDSTNLTEKFKFKHSDSLLTESPFLSALKFSLDNATRKNSKDHLSIPWVGEVSSRVRRLSIYAAEKP